MISDGPYQTPLQAAQHILALGIAPLPIPLRTKAPKINDWQKLRPTEQDLPALFSESKLNIGGILGNASNGIVSIDLDWMEAVRLAPSLFGRSWSFGRVIDGMLQTRHVLIQSPGLESKDFIAPVSVARKDRMIVQLLSTGKQAVLPGSLYEDGSPITWVQSPETVSLLPMDAAQVLVNTETLAGAALLARIWPDLEGSRHVITMALAGVLIKQWPPELVRSVLYGISQTGGDRDRRDRKNAIEDTIQKSGRGEPVTGLPTLVEHLDDAVLQKLVEWWHLSTNDYSDLIGIGKVQSNARHATGTSPEPPEVYLHSELASNITLKPISWLWKGRMARGKLTLIAGDPGLGKSLISASLAKHVTCGIPWPVDNTPCEPGKVLILSAEDDPADTIVPRLLAAGADRSKAVILKSVVHKQGDVICERGFSLKTDLSLLDAQLNAHPDCRMVIIDPVSAYLGDKTDSHKDADVRALLEPASRLAAQHDVALVLIAHLNKGQSSAAYRVMGSIAFSGAPRSTHMVIRDKGDLNTRLFLPGKNNIGPDTMGLSYTVGTVQASTLSPNLAQVDDDVPFIQWGDSLVAMTVDEALESEDKRRESPARDTALEFLRAFLQDGAKPVPGIKDQAIEAGLKWPTVQDARMKHSNEVGTRRTEEDTTKWEWFLIRPTAAPE